MLGVRAADIDLESGTLRFTRSVTRTAGQTIVRERTKSGKSYAVSIDKATIAAIKAQQTDQRTATRAAGVTMNPNPFLFDDRKSLTGSAPMSPNAVKSWWSRQAVAESMPDADKHRYGKRLDKFIVSERGGVVVIVSPPPPIDQPELDKIGGRAATARMLRAEPVEIVKNPQRLRGGYSARFGFVPK